MTPIGSGDFFPSTFILKAVLDLNGSVLSKALIDGFFSLSKSSGFVFGGDTDLTFDTIDLVLQAFKTVSNTDDEKDLGNDIFMERVKISTLSASFEFVDFFNSLTENFVSDFKAHPPIRRAVNTRYQTTAAGLMALACALDQPQPLQQLVEAFPAALQQELSADCSGACNASPMQKLKETSDNRADARFFAPFFAIHYSSITCLDVFVSAGWTPFDPLGSYLFSDQASNGIRQVKAPLLFLDLMAEDAMLFRPCMLAKVVALLKEGDDWPKECRDALYKQALSCLNAAESMSSGYAGTFFASGVYDIDLPCSLHQAAMHGAIELFEAGDHPIPWAKTAHHSPGKEPLLMTIVRNGQIQRGAEQAETRVLKMLALARRDGAATFFDLGIFEDGGLDFIKLLVDADMAGVLRHYLDCGLSLTKPIGDGDENLLDLLERADENQHPRVRQLGRAFMARQCAFEALAEIARLNCR